MAAVNLDLANAGEAILQQVWALHALIDGNRENQLVLQAAGGAQILVGLAQACLQPAAVDLPLSPSHSALNSSSQSDPNMQGDSYRTHSSSAARRQTTEQLQLMTALVEVIGCLAADVFGNQQALHEAGAVPLLLHQIQWSSGNEAMDASMWALGTMAKDNADAKADVQLQVAIGCWCQYT